MTQSQIPTETRERITAAADALYAEAGRERLPTVDQVRRAARADMAAVSAVMRDWRRQQTAAAAPVAVAIPEAIQQTATAALAGIWTQAQELAGQALQAAQAAWEIERSELDALRSELAEAFEAQAVELEALRASHAQAIDQHQEALRAAIEQHREELAQAQASAADAREQTAMLKGQLQATETHSAALLTRLDTIGKKI